MRYLTRLDQLPLPADERARLSPVAERFAFRISAYYMSLIDWSDPGDPLRRIVVPDVRELEDGGTLDASAEAENSPLRGVQHKYPHTVLLLCNEVCGSYCRYCFRKRLFMNDNDEVSNDLRAGLAYIADRPQVTNVLLTGGDPLLMSTRRLSAILDGLRAIPHVRIIRIGSKMPAFDPSRFDDDLLTALSAASTPARRVYLMAHFDHPRELTGEARAAMARVQQAGVVVVNQCPLLRGINDDPAVLAELFRQLSFAGISPYYVFQGRPTSGNRPFEVPLVEAFHTFEDARRRVSGLARRARLVMSHATGKIEVVGVDERHIYLRYLRARLAEDEGRMLVCRRDDRARWLDELTLAPELGGRLPLAPLEA